AQDLTLTRSALRALLERSANVQVVGEAGNGYDAVQLAQKLNPNVVLMDVLMPGLNGIEATRQIRAARPQILVLMLSVHTDRHYLLESVRAGAAGYILKDVTVDEFLSALQTVVAGGTYLSRSLTDMAVEYYIQLARGKPGASELGKLSAREKEVLQLISE